MAKSSISMAIFNGKLLVYQRVNPIARAHLHVSFRMCHSLYMLAKPQHHILSDIYERCSETVEIVEKS